MPGMIELSDGTKIRQAYGATTPATFEGGTGGISTGAKEPKSKEAILADGLNKLIYIGSGLILLGVLIIGFLKYPTPGGLVVAAGVLLIGFQQYPWMIWVSVGLCAIGAGIYYGHEIGENKPIPN